MFITQDDDKIIIKIIFRTEKFYQTDKALTVVQTKFSRTYFENLSRKELGKLDTAARDMFHFISEFGKLHSVQNDMSVYFLI